MTTMISFIRHGRVHNPEHLLYGRLPRFALSDRGVADAQAVAQTLRAGPSISHLYSSPLLRARQTAEAILTLHPHLVIHISQLINEVHTSFEGRPLAELALLGFDLYAPSPPGYERPGDVLARMLRFVELVRQRHAGRRVVAVTHGDPITFVIQWVSGLPIGPRKREALIGLGLSSGYPAPASITTLTFEVGQGDPRPALSYVEPVPGG
ncbi:MAG: histidine phosphatase family protein [Anaerolineae bacterium]|nr:histidine phosphatase family protein [Anaerolineae bacterium]